MAGVITHSSAHLSSSTEEESDHHQPNLSDSSAHHCARLMTGGCVTAVYHIHVIICRSIIVMSFFMIRNSMIVV